MIISSESLPSLSASQHRLMKTCTVRLERSPMSNLILHLNVQNGVRVEEEDEEQTWDTRSNASTLLKTSASTCRCAFCCSRAAAPRDLMEEDRKRSD